MDRTSRHYREDFGLDSRVARFDKVYGPLGGYDGEREKSPAAICRKDHRVVAGDGPSHEREKSPAAICRKVVLARDRDEIEVRGDDQQTRSYCARLEAADAARGDLGITYDWIRD